MALDMLELRCLAERRLVPVQLAQPLVQGRIPAADIPDVAFEVLYVHHVEAHDRRVEPDICFRDVLAIVEGSGRGGKVRFGAVEGGEELRDGLFVGSLRRGEAGLVDAVVDVVVGPVVRLFDGALMLVGEEHDVAVFLGQQVVESGVEHADYFR